MKAALRTVLGIVLFAGMFLAVWLRVGVTGLFNMIRGK